MVSKPNNTNEISLYEFTRWAALLEAVEIIAAKCEDKGIDFDSPQGIKYVKPLDIQDYVDTRSDKLLMKLKVSRSIERNLNSIKCLQIEQQLKRLVVVD